MGSLIFTNAIQNLPFTWEVFFGRRSTAIRLYLCPLHQQWGELVRHVSPHVVAACELFPTPSPLACELIELREWAGLPAARQHIADGRDGIAVPAQVGRGFETRQWLHGALTVHPRGIRGLDGKDRRWG